MQMSLCCRKTESAFRKIGDRERKMSSSLVVPIKLRCQCATQLLLHTIHLKWVTKVDCCRLIAKSLNDAELRLSLYWARENMGVCLALHSSCVIIRDQSLERCRGVLGVH